MTKQFHSRLLSRSKSTSRQAPRPDHWLWILDLDRPFVTGNYNPSAAKAPQPKAPQPPTPACFLSPQGSTAPPTQPPRHLSPLILFHGARHTQGFPKRQPQPSETCISVNCFPCASSPNLPASLRMPAEKGPSRHCGARSPEFPVVPRKKYVCAHHGSRRRPSCYTDVQTAKGPFLLEYPGKSPKLPNFLATWNPAPQTALIFKKFKVT